MNDESILEGLCKALEDFNKYVSLASKNGMIVNIYDVEITGMEDRVRCKMYVLSVDKRLMGGLD